MFFHARSSASTIALALVLWAGLGAAANAACYAPDQQVPAAAVADFLNNSDKVLQDPNNAKGGEGMINTVRDLVASNPAALPVVISMLSRANKEQQAAIGNALAQAADKLCKTTDPVYAADIQSRLAASGSEAAINEYAAITGNAPIRAVAGGGGGVSGGSSGGSTSSPGTPSGGSSLTPFTANSVAGNSTNYFTGGASGAGSAGNTNTTIAATPTTSTSP